MRFAFVAALLMATVPVFGQIDNGNITGRVTDASGAVIVGAKVSLIEIETNFEADATTNGDGLYRALSLKPGPYRITVVAPGFKKAVSENNDLRINSTLAVDFSLELGAVTESVDVKATAQLLDTETSSSGTTMEGDFLYNLPNYQRHATAVLFFTPGVTISSNQDTKGLFGTIDGIGTGQMAYFEDGVLADFGGRGSGQSETVDNSIEEIKVFTSAMPAEYGHSAGVGVSIVKKSGANEIHGLLSEQFRTRSMQHRKFFDQYRNSQSQPGFLINPPPLIVQNPDASFSGPVYIPKIYNGKNKTFFFYGMQMLIEKQGKQLLATVPTPAMLGGDFSFAGSGVVANQIYDPDTTANVNGVWSRQPFPGNIIPKSRWSKVATAFLATNPIGAPNVPGTWTNTGPNNNVQLAPMKITMYHSHTGRIDHQFTPNFKAFTTYTYNQEWGRQPPIAIINPLFDSSLNKGITYRNTGSVGATWIVKPTMVNDLRLNYYSTDSDNSSIALNNNYAALVGLGSAGLPTTCLPGVIPGFITDQASLSPGCGNRTVTENYTVKDDLSKSWRAHNFKMGYELLRFHNNANSGPGNVDGVFNYGQSTNNTAGSGVGGLTASGNAIANTGGIALAQFLTGDINGFSFSQSTDNLYTRSWEHSMYVQDDWRVSKTLTLNLGLRYEIEPPKTYAHGYISLFDLNAPDNTVYTGATPWTAFCPAGGCMGAYTHPKNATPFDTDWRRLDPTLGLAWNVSNKMVVRAGARISHIDTFSDGTSLIFNNELLAKSYSVSQVAGNFAPLFNLNNGIPAWSYPALRADGSAPTVATNAGAVSPTIVPRNLKTPYVATWNVAVQRQLGKSSLVELRWEGSAQSKGFGNININTRPTGIIPSPNHDGTMLNLNDPANALYRYQWATGTIASYQTQWARPYPNLGNVDIECNCVHSSHNAGIVSFQHRTTKGLSFQGFYTYSRSMGMSSTTNLNPYMDWGLYKARQGSDQTHNFTGSMVYALPVGKGHPFLGHSSRLVNAILGDYNVSWTYTIASGTPAGMSLSGYSLPSYTAGSSTFTNINVPQYPTFMPIYGDGNSGNGSNTNGLILLQRPSLRDSWQDLGGDRFNQGNQNSMINCGPTVVNHGNNCFTFAPAFTNGNAGANVWNNQRIIAASLAMYKEIPLKERLRLQLRLDMQNPFKWFNWGGPSTSLNVQSLSSANTFGKINPANYGETQTGTQGYGGVALLNMTVALKW